MMKLIYTILFVAVFSTPKAWTKDIAVSQNEATEELTYDDLLSELKSHQSRFQKETHHPYDDLLIHAGLGLVSTVSSIEVQGSHKNWQQNGLELSVGADLFSKKWYTEGTFRNYGVESSGMTELSMKQLDFKIAFRDQLHNPLVYHLGAGLSTRSINYSDPFAKLSLSENSPAFLAFGGIGSELTPLVTIGLEVGARSPFVSSHLDRGSLELGLLLKLSI